MEKYSLTKSIEARKLNPRTGVATTDPEVTIPFGGIIENIEPDRDMDRFTHHGEPYRCPHDVLASAIEKEKTAPAPAAAAVQAAPPAKATMQWEPLVSGQIPLMRAKVPGGWLVAAAGGAGLAYYPDPQHQWSGC